MHFHGFCWYECKTGFWIFLSLFLIADVMWNSSNSLHGRAQRVCCLKAGFLLPGMLTFLLFLFIALLSVPEAYNVVSRVDRSCLTFL